MENPESYPIIGSDHEGRAEMYQAESLSGDDLAVLEKQRNERGIFPDVEARYARALEQAGYEQVRMLENGIQYPSADEWINHRIKYSRGTKFYPSFVQKEGAIYFCKSQIRNDSAQADALEHEAEVMKSIPAGINAPKVVEFCAAEGDTVAFLLTEAIPFDEATIRSVDDWQENDVVRVAAQIDMLESASVASAASAENIQAVEAPEGVQDDCDKIQSIYGEAREAIDQDLLEKIDSVIERFSAVGRKVLAHGDLTTKNVLIGSEKVYLVDWELSEKSFQGRDIGKLWSGLNGRKDLQDMLMHAYVQKGTAVDEARLAGVRFGVIYENLIHLAWRNSEIINKNRASEFPKVQDEIVSYNRKIRSIFE